MLSELYADLTTLHLDFQKAAAAGCEREAASLLDRVVALEKEIFDSPVRAPGDETIKLRLLLVELWHDLTPRQRRVLDEVVSTLESERRPILSGISRA